MEPLEERALLSLTVGTDKPDYIPGETATITASGLTPGETVEFQVLHVDDTPNTGAGHLPWQVADGSADDLDGLADGNVQTTWYVSEDDSLHSVLQVTATGLTSGLNATVEFSDALTTVLSDDFPEAYYGGWYEPLANPAKWAFGTMLAKDNGTSGPRGSSGYGAYAAKFNGWWPALVSQPINLQNYVSGSLYYSVQAGGREGWPQPFGVDDLVILYRRSDGSWKELKRENSWDFELDDPFFRHYVDLPEEAFHSNFALNFSTDNGTWWIDGVRLYAQVNRAPTLNYSVPGATVLDSSTPSIWWSASDLDNNLSSVTATWTGGGESGISQSINDTLWPSKTTQTLPVRYDYSIIATDLKNVSTSKTGYYNLEDDDSTPPAITLELRGPNGLNLVNGPEAITEFASADQRFYWKVNDASNSSSSVTITKTVPGQPPQTILSRTYSSNVSADWFDFNSFGVGKYQITITATDKDLDRGAPDQLPASVSRTVNVIYTPPQAVLTISTPPAGRLEGSAIAFDATESIDPDGNPLTYVWNFGDGTLGQGATPTHVYADNGNYQVKLVVVDPYNVASVTQSLVIQNVAPTVQATSSATAEEAAPFTLDLALSDPGKDTASLLVDWGDGDSQTYTSDGRKEHVYRDGGNQYTIRVSAADEDGTYPNLYTATVDVLNAPPVIADSPAFLTAEANQAIDMNVTVVDGVNDVLTYAWDFDDDPPQAEVDLSHVSHAYAAEGVFSVSLTVTDSDGLSAMATWDVVVGSPVSFTEAERSVAENAGSLLITARLDHGTALDHDVIIPLTVHGGVNEGDFELPVAQITIPQGQLAGSVSLEIRDDSLDENDEELVVAMGLTVGASRGALSQQRVLIQDNDSKPSVFFLSQSRTVDESLPALALTASLSAVSGRDVVVPLAFTETAVAGADYELPVQPQIKIPAGALTGSYELRLIDDTQTEGAERIVVSMLPSQQADLSTEVGQTTVVSLIIPQNDAPVVSLDYAYRLVAEDSVAIKIGTRLSQFSDQTISVPFTLSGSPDHAATNGEDYQILASVFEFPPGSWESEITVNITDDVKVEGIEDFLIQLQPVANANLGTSQWVLTDILDNDQVQVSFEPWALSYFEGTTNIPIKLTLSKQSSAPTTIPITITGTASTGDDFTISTQLVVQPWTPYGTLNLSLLDDSLNESPETIFLSLGDIIGGVPGEYMSKAVTIQDTDPLVNLIATQRSVTEGGQPLELTVRLSAPTNQDVTVPIQYSGTARRGTDFAAPTSITIPAGETSAVFTITVPDDSEVEPEKTLGVTLGTPSVGVPGPLTSVSLTVADNDVLPGIYWENSSYRVPEDSETIEMRASLSAAAASDVTLVLQYSADAAQPYEDFLPGPATITIPRGQSSATFSVVIVNDGLPEDNESFVVSFVSVTNATLPDFSLLRKTTVTIMNDDELTAVELQRTVMVGDWLLEQATSAFDSWWDAKWKTWINNPTAQGDFATGFLLAVNGAAFILGGPLGVFITGVVTGTLNAYREKYPLDGWINWGALERDFKEDPWLFARKFKDTLAERASVEGLKALGGWVWSGIVSASDWIGKNVTDDQIKGGIEYYAENTIPHVQEEAETLWTKAFGGGYGNGSVVFFDADFNGIRSSEEAFGRTSADGLSIIRGVERADANTNSLLDFYEGQWAAEGGTDTSTNQLFRIAFVAPANYALITPSSTLVSKLIEIGAFERSGSGIRDAEQRYFAALGLQDRPLAYFDFVREAADGNYDAAALFGKETQLYNTVVMAASFFEGRSGGMPFRFLADLAIEDIAQKIAAPGSSLDLSRKEVVANILKGISVRTGIDLEANVSNTVAEAMAQANRLIDQAPVEGSRSYLDAVVKVQSVAQGHLSEVIRSLSRGEITVSQFQAMTNNLQGDVDNAQAFNVLPVYLGVSSASVVEGNDGSTELEFIVTPYGDSALPITVDYQTARGTAIDGVDYVGTSGTLSWDAGDSSPKSIFVSVSGDLELESDEYFSILLSRATNATIFANGARGTIANDDMFSHVTPVGEDNDLALSVEGPQLFLQQDGAVIFQGSFQNGASIELSGQDGDRLTLRDVGSPNIVETVDLAGTRLFELSGHTIRVAGIDDISGDFTTSIVGIPGRIYAEVPLSLGATVPASFADTGLSFGWKVFAAGSDTPAQVGDSQTFDFTPTLVDHLLEVTVTDGMRVSALRYEIAVHLPNAAPAFTKGADVVALEDAGTQEMAGWATAISPGPADESYQLVNFLVANDNSGLFTVPPAIAANGTLTFTPAANANGVATVTVALHDDGGTEYGGVDTSATQSFTITITPVNDVPSFIKGGDVAVLEDAGSQTLSDWATAISAGRADEAGQVLNFLVGNDNNALFAAQPALSADGTLTFTPADNANGTATVTVRLHDDGGTAHGGVDTSAAQTFTITVTAVNDAPTAYRQTVTVTEDGVVAIELHGSDVETTEANLTFTVTSLPAEGILKNGGVAVAAGDSFTGPPTLTYEPGIARDGADSDSFTFTVTDRGDPDTPGSVGRTSDPATVDIQITPTVGEGQVTFADGIMRIGGTSLSDVILVTHTADNLYLQVAVNGIVVSNTTRLSDISKVRAWGRAGNDRIEVIDLALMAMLHGGEGDDELTGGAGDDLILGGLGSDKLTGGSGNDFLIGGKGSDRIVGSAGHDILVAGDVASRFTDEALRQISAAWAATKRVEEAVDDILDEEIIDANFDQLTGSSGADWFIISSGDKVTDFKINNKDGDVVTVI
jgi:PKD repeat protein